MVSNTRDRNIDSSRREDSRKGQVDRCEVINVRPHVQPYPEDKDFNTVDVQLIDRPRVNEAALTIEYVKLNSLQREHGKFQGIPWNARIGDMIYVYWLAEREALVLGTCTSVEQEPVCRSQADDQQQEYVFKLCPWEEPQKNADGNYIIFPNPKHPDCHKWWPKTRDSLWIFDCLEGHNTPSCCAQAPCNSLDDHQSSTCIKHFSDVSPTIIDKQWRFKILHHCGSNLYFDEDGVVNLENQVAHVLKNRVALYPDTGYSDEHGPIAFEAVNLATKALVRIYVDGCVRVRSSVDPTGDTLCSELFLKNNGNCWLWNGITDNSVEIQEDGKIVLDGNVEITGDLVVDGSLTHGNGPCCTDDFVEC